MNRRDFLTKLGIGAAACAVVPKIVEENNDYDYEEVYDISDEQCETVGIQCAAWDDAIAEIDMRLDMAIDNALFFGV